MKKLFLLFFLGTSSLSFSQNEYLLGENYYREGEFEKATQIFKKLYSKSPFNTNYLNRLISCYQELDEFLVAENLLKSRIKANATQTYLYVFLGHNYERQQKNEKARIYYEMALKLVLFT